MCASKVITWRTLKQFRLVVTGPLKNLRTVRSGRAQDIRIKQHVVCCDISVQQEENLSVFSTCLLVLVLRRKDCPPLLCCRCFDMHECCCSCLLQAFISLAFFLWGHGLLREHNKARLIACLLEEPYSIFTAHWSYDKSLTSSLSFDVFEGL